MSEFPVDAQTRYLYAGKGWLRDVVNTLWTSRTSYLLPWRIRVAVWNWMWELKEGDRINWRTRKRFCDG